MQDFNYKTSTNNIEVAVRPQFVSSIANNNRQETKFSWRYFVKIRNNSTQTIQIINRYWKIIHEDGSIEKISGSGIVGKQPVLTPQLEFEYDSQVQLDCGSAIMGGYYEAKKQNNESFKIIIPNFSLDVPNSQKIVN